MKFIAKFFFKIILLTPIFMSMDWMIADAQTDIPGKNGTRFVAVSGHAERGVAPDIAYLRIEVKKQDADGKKAQALVADLSNTLMAVLKDESIDTKDIRTESIYCAPIMTDESSARRHSRLVQTGFSCDVEIKVSIRRLDIAPLLLVRLLAADANLTLSLRYEIEDRAKYEDQLRVAAIDNARSQAEILSKAAGMHLGSVLKIDTDAGGFRSFEVSGPPHENRSKAIVVNATMEPAVGDISLEQDIRVWYELMVP